MGERLTATAVKEYQDKMYPDITIGEFKALARELRDRFGLTSSDALDLLRGDNVLDILAKNEAAND